MKSEKDFDFLLGKKPLSKVQGVPCKDMVESLRKNKDAYKGNMYENLTKKCLEVYMPPGVIKYTPTRFEK